MAAFRWFLRLLAGLCRPSSADKDSGPHSPSDGPDWLAVIAQRPAEYAGYMTRELYVTGADPAIVLIHGFGDSAGTWNLVLSRLAAIGRAGIAVDLPGFGAAEALAPGPILPQLDAFVADVVQRHGARQSVVLVGNSLGGLLTVRAAADGALPIRGILAVGTAGTGWTRLLRIVTQGNLGRVAWLAKAPVPAWLLTLTARVMMYGRWQAADPVELRRFTRQLAARPIMATALALLPEVTAITQLAHVTCPTTVLHGRRDRLVSMEAAQRLHDLIPCSRLVVLPRSGHCPQLDAADEVVTLATQLATTNPEDYSGTA